MPKQTFHRLSEEKKKQFISTALKEFAYKDYQSASITKIVKDLKIAKGSVYQYFEDKLELYLFLKEYSEKIKLGYINSINRNDFPDFWSFYRRVYENGVNFDLQHPLPSLFLFRIGFREHHPELEKYLCTWKNKAKEMMTQWIEEEIKAGNFREDIAVQTIAQFMVTCSLSIAEILQERYQVNYQENIDSGKPLFGNNKEELMNAVDELIALMKNGINAQK